MLSEQFISSTLASAGTFNNSKNATHATLKDAGIHISSLKPVPRMLETAFKKSSTRPNCLATSATHIYAAQAEKAVIHVYSREKRSQEATVPFSERIHSIVFANDRGGVGTLIMGTEDGRVILWEVATGRQISTPQSHLQAVTSLAVSSDGLYLVSGSSDSTIRVWSLPNLLSFAPALNEDAYGLRTSMDPTVLQILSRHRAPITAMAINKSSLHGSAYLVSASSDSTVIVWNYLTGTPLLTFLLPSPPLSIALDPCDRAIYVGLEDGSIQLIDLLALQNGGHSALEPNMDSTNPILTQSDLFLAPSESLGPTHAIALPYDATTILSAHASGVIIQWDIPSRRFSKKLTPTPLPYPITNLLTMLPTGFSNTKRPSIQLETIVKPRYDASFGPAGTNGMNTGLVPGAYSIRCRFNTELADQSEGSPQGPFRTALCHPSLPDTFLCPPKFLHSNRPLNGSKSSLIFHDTKRPRYEQRSDEAEEGLSPRERELQRRERAVTEKEHILNMVENEMRDHSESDDGSDSTGSDGETHDRSRTDQNPENPIIDADTRDPTNVNEDSSADEAPQSPKRARPL